MELIEIGNEENVRPSELNGPSDVDRARFGFKGRMRPPRSVEASPAKDVAMISSESLQLPPKEVLTPRLALCSRMDSGMPFGCSAPPALPGLECARPQSLNLVALLDSEFGDQDAAQAVLKYKPRAGRYDFKDQIEELKTVIKPLRDALAERLRREVVVRDALAQHQADIDAYVSSLDSRIAHSDRLINEKLAQERELNAQKVQKLRNLVLETERAWQQKELVQERAVAERDRDTEELHRQALTKVQAELKESKDDFERRLQEASRLLQSQIEESGRLTQEMQATAEQKQKVSSAEWSSKLDHAAQQAQEREARLRSECEEQLGEASRRETALVAAQAAEVAALREAHRVEATELREAHEAEVAARQQAHTEALDRALVDASSRESTAAARHREEVSLLTAELQEAHATEARRLAELRAAREQEVKELSERHACVEAELREALARGSEEAGARERRLRAEREAAELEVQAEHATTVLRLQADRLAKDQQLQAAHADEVQRLQADAAARLEESEARATQRERELTVDAVAAAAASQQREQELLSRLERHMTQAQEAASDLQFQSEASASAARSREEDFRSQLKAANFRTKQLADDLASSRERADAQEEQLQQEILKGGHRIRKLEGDLATERSTRERENLAKATLQGEHTTLLSVVTENRATLQEFELLARSSQDRVAGLQQDLRGSEAEGERLREAVAEEQARLQKQQEELDTARAQLAALRGELAVANSELVCLRDRSKRLSVSKRDLEVEFNSYREHNSTSNSAQMEAITDLKVTVDKLNQRMEVAQLEIGAKSGDIEAHQRCIRRLEEHLSQAESSRRELHNTIQELRGNIRVFCRVRPGPSEAASPLNLEDGKLMLTHGGESYNFSFDKVFGPSSVQEDLFAEVSGLVQSAMDGYKVCIFAYGQTGSGKTYTMQGNAEPSTWGMIPRSLRQIFKASEDMKLKGWTWSLKASFMEVYNEVIRDLLRDDVSSKSTTTPQCHTIKHDADWGTMVTNMTCVQVTSIDHINQLTARAAKLRAVGATDLNAVSSRSHSIFALYLSGSNAELNSELRGALHLVDLAGSERLDRSHAQGDRLKETQNINRSLSSLADVFLAKAESRSHVPFRNSKLTHLMEPCLSGQGKTLMAVNVGPEALNSHETLCSLRFASQVSQCNTGGKPKRSQKALSKTTSTVMLPTASSMTRRGGC